MKNDALSTASKVLGFAALVVACVGLGNGCAAPIEEETEAAVEEAGASDEAALCTPLTTPPSGTYVCSSTPFGNNKFENLLVALGCTNKGTYKKTTYCDGLNVQTWYQATCPGNTTVVETCLATGRTETMNAQRVAYCFAKSIYSAAGSNHCSGLRVPTGSVIVAYDPTGCGSCRY